MLVLLFGVFTVTYATGTLEKAGTLCPDLAGTGGSRDFTITPGLNLIADNR
jgi:hypothetical protein